MVLVIAFAVFSICCTCWITISQNLLAHWYLYWVPVVLLFVFFLIALILFLLVAYLSTLHINVDEVKERPNPFGVFICEEFAAFLLYISGIRVVLTGLEKVPADNSQPARCAHALRLRVSTDTRDGNGGRTDD